MRKPGFGNKDFRSLNSRIKPKKTISSHSYMPVNTITSNSTLNDYSDPLNANITIPKEIEVDSAYELHMKMNTQTTENRPRAVTDIHTQQDTNNEIKVYELFKIIINPMSANETLLVTGEYKMTLETNELKIMSIINSEPNILATFKLRNIETIEYSYNDMDKINMVISLKHPKTIRYRDQDIPTLKLWIFLPLYDRDSKKYLFKRISLMDTIKLEKANFGDMKNKYFKPTIPTIPESNFYGSSSSSKSLSDSTFERLSSLTDLSRTPHTYSSSIATRKRPLRGVQIDYKGLEDAVVEDSDSYEAPKTAETLYELVPFSEQIVFQPSLHFKFDEKTKITISNKDFQCLYNGNWVNDSIVDFFIRYSLKKAKESGSITKEKFEIMSSFFYSKLSTEVTDGDYYSNVKTWFKSNNNLFDNDYLIIPINVSLHWFCVVITNLPKLKRVHLQRKKEMIKQRKQEEQNQLSLLSEQAATNAETDPSIPGIQRLNIHSQSESTLGSDVSPSTTTETRKYARIFILDSLKKLHHDIVAPLKSFLVGYAKDKYGLEIKTSEITKHTCSIPQQDNFNDCGLHVVYNLEQLFSDPTEFNKKILVDKKRKRNETILANKMFKDDEKKRLRDTLRSTLVKLLKEEVEKEGGDTSKIGMIKNKDTGMEPVNDKENIVYEDSDDDEIVFIDEKINKPEVDLQVIPTHPSSASVKSPTKRTGKRKITEEKRKLAEDKRANKLADNLTVSSSSKALFDSTKSPYFDKVSEIADSVNSNTPKFVYKPTVSRGKALLMKNLLSDDDYKGDGSAHDMQDNVKGSRLVSKGSPIMFSDDDDLPTSVKGHADYASDGTRDPGSILFKQKPELVSMPESISVPGPDKESEPSSETEEDNDIEISPNTPRNDSQSDVPMSDAYIDYKLISQVEKDEARANDLIRKIDEEVSEKDLTATNLSEFQESQQENSPMNSSNNFHKIRTGGKKSVVSILDDEIKPVSDDSKGGSKPIKTIHRKKVSNLPADSYPHGNIPIETIGGAINIPIVVSSKAQIKTDSSGSQTQQIRNKIPTEPKRSSHINESHLKVSPDIYILPDSPPTSPRRSVRHQSYTNYCEEDESTDGEEGMNSIKNDKKKRTNDPDNQKLTIFSQETANDDASHVENTPKNISLPDQQKQESSSEPVYVTEAAPSLNSKKYIPMSKTESPIKFSNEGEVIDSEGAAPPARVLFPSKHKAPVEHIQVSRKNERKGVLSPQTPISRINHILKNSDRERSRINSKRIPKKTSDSIRLSNGHVDGEKVFNNDFKDDKLKLITLDEVRSQRLNPSEFRIAGSSSSTHDDRNSSGLQISGVSSVNFLSNINISGTSDLQISSNTNTNKSHKRERLQETDHNKKKQKRSEHIKMSSNYKSKKFKMNYNNNHNGKKSARRSIGIKHQSETESPSFERLGDFSP